MGRSPRELAPAEPSFLDEQFPEEMCPECLSAVVRSPGEPTPAGQSMVVRFSEEPTPAEPSSAVAQFHEELTPDFCPQ